MTAPGVYNPEQAAAHARRVARDEDDTEAREVACMAEAMAPEIARMMNRMASALGGSADVTPIATAARNALLAYRAKGE